VSHDEQWEACERWRAERNRKRDAEDAGKMRSSSARGRRVFLTEMTGWLLGWLAIFGLIYLVVWLDDAFRSPKEPNCRTATWYLVVPPGPTSSWGVDADAPLAEWQIDGCFDSAEKCKSDRVQQVQESESETEKDQADNDSVPPSLAHQPTPDVIALLDRFIVAQTSAARCVSRDDIASKK
jgi:hypothetical protein